MTILATTGDVKTRSSEDANGILEIFCYLFGVKKRFYMIKRVPLCCNFMALSALLSRTISKRAKGKTIGQIIIAS